MKPSEYRLDRTAFQKLSFEEADKQMQQSEHLSQEERFRQFNYLMSVAYRFLGESWPAMDKSTFEMRKHN
ncbi:MAG: hypothetical protein ABI688_06720 [Bacteroidota bacterium]